MTDAHDTLNTPEVEETAEDAARHAHAGSNERRDIDKDAIVEALLFATDQPLPGAKIAKVLGVGDAGDVSAAIDRLNERYDREGAAFRIESIAKGYQILTRPPFDRWVRKLHKDRSESRLSTAALETLAIVAYKQPVLRADIEAVRGVAVGDMLVRLRDMNLVRIVGRAEEVGRPLLYGTTSRFLDVFGLNSLKDLPPLDPDRPNEMPPLRMSKGPDEEAEPQSDNADPAPPEEN